MENTKRTYKIRSKKSYEREINEESRILTTNSLVLGLASLGTVIAFTSVGAESLELSQRIGSLCLGLVGTYGVKESFQSVKDAMARKIKLENQYEIHYGNDEKGKSL